MSLLGGKFEFTPFTVALRETVEWLVEHYDTDARIGRRKQGSNGAYNGEANGHNKEAPARVEREEDRMAE